jgi:tetratricopeptide (TPR) repeat protein
LLARFATALDELGQHADADAALSDALAIDPASEAAWIASAELAVRRGDIARAMLAYERAEAAAPASSTAPLALAALLRTQHDEERALAVLERYEARMLPGSTGAVRARLALALARDDASGAYAAAQAWLARSNAADDALGVTARALLAERRAPLAKRLLDALPPRDSHAALRLAVLLACAERDAVENLLAQAPADALGGLLAVARAYAAIGREAQALELAQLAAARDPHDRAALSLRSELALRLGGLPDLAHELNGERQ